MQNTTLESKILCVLDEVKAKGYIPSKNNQISVYSQKIDHFLNDFLKKGSVDPEASVIFMDKMVEISRRAPAFLPLFGEKIIALYDKANDGKTITKNKAETKLLLFFASVSPQSVAQKVELLNRIQEMPDWLRRKKEVSKVVGQIANHYDLNKQFREDSDSNFLSCLSNILNKIAESITTKRRRISVRGVQAPEKDLFYHCATVIRKYTPELYNNLWAESFSKSPFKKQCVTQVKDVTIVPFIPKKRCRGIPRFYD